MCTGETLQVPQSFYLLTAKNYVNIRKYDVGNGVFASQEFWDEIIPRQTINFSEVIAYHKNGVAYKAIKDVIWMAQYIMLHSDVCCPSQVLVELWHFSLQYVTCMHNTMMDKSWFI